MFSHWSTTIRGSSHERDGKICQDASGVAEGDWYVVAAVADGHGSEKHFRSDIGSKIAVDVSLDTIKGYMEDRSSFEEAYGRDPDGTIDHMKATIISRWYDGVSSYDSANPLTDDESALVADMHSRGVSLRSVPTGERYEGVEFQRYGSTLLISVLTEGFAFGIQIGDGDMVVMRGHDLRMPMPFDSRCIQPYTTSMCDKDVFDSMRHWRTPPGRTLDAMVVSTDGAIKSFSGEDSYMRFCCAVVSVLDDGGEDRVTESLKVRAAAGGDDTSLAVVRREGYRPAIPLREIGRDITYRPGRILDKRTARRRELCAATRRGRHRLRGRR